MLWQLQLFLAGLEPAQSLDLCFVVLCLATACGLGPRWSAILAAGLYLVCAII
ncbi:hypothetical protein [Shimia ponticola]|uniref:hypothetical protein n=1 Tax=Shimia ponticola TaxID=2582893 RepID=UPI00164BF6B4|nr:hypothetical protein [Shimia ponticola]